MHLNVSNGIHLTDFRKSDRNNLVTYLSEREIYDNTLRIPFPYTAALAEQWLERVQKQTQQVGHSLNWVIRTQEEQLIGAVGLERQGPDAAHYAELGYWLAKPYWGRGIMTDVIKAVSRYTFETMGYEKLIAHVFSFNSASARVLEKSGFEIEGYLKKHRIKNGKFVDSKLYGLLRDQGGR